MSNRRQFIQLATAAGITGVGTVESAQAAGSRYAIQPMAVPSLPIEGSQERFPVHRIYCMGLNYAEHVKEGVSKGGPNVPPFYFQKANDMIVQNNSTVRYPSQTKDYQYELELVVALAKGGTNIPVEKALDYVFGYAVGLDMTRRDLQKHAMDNRIAWEPGKSFEQCAPCAAIHPVSKVGHLSTGRLQLKVNDEIHQDADIGDMIYNVPKIISFLSESIELAPGDLIYTGTPAGVGPVVSGDRMVGTIERLGTLVITVA